MQGKLENDNTYTGKHSEKTWENLKFTSQADPWYRASLQQSVNKPTTTQQTLRKEENPISRLTIIRLIYPVFNK